MTEAGGPITLQRRLKAVIEISIVGRSPIIMNKWSHKAIILMPGYAGPDAPTVKTRKGKHQPEEEAEDATYRLPDRRPGIPATAFKAAITGAARAFDDKRITMVKLRPDLFVFGEGPDQLVPIEGKEVLREDTPRNKDGSTTLRYRHAYHDWRATLRIQYPADDYTADAIVALVDAAGDSGVGDWRPSSPKSLSGTYGTWTVDERATISTSTSTTFGEAAG